MRCTTWVIALVLTAAGALRAEDFWLKKKYTEWTEKEIKQMFTNSPWARRLDVPVGGTMGGRGGRGGGRGRGGGMGADGGFGAADSIGGGDDLGGGGFGRGGGGGGGGADVGAVPTLPVTIRWETALPIRQARAKMRWGAEVATSAEAAKMLAAQENFYVIVIGNLPGQRFMAIPPGQLKSTSMLRLGKRPPVYASEVKYGSPGPVSEIYLVFPRNQNGAQVITLEDKEVELITSIGPLEIRRKFRLKEMVFDGKLEL